MLRKLKVVLDNGKEVQKIFASGRVVRVTNEMGKPLSFDLAVNKGENTEYLNRISVSQDAKFKSLVENFKKGQQLFCEINVTTVEKDEKVYENLWLFSFDYGKGVQNND